MAKGNNLTLDAYTSDEKESSQEKESDGEMYLSTSGRKKRPADPDDHTNGNKDTQRLISNKTQRKKKKSRKTVQELPNNQRAGREAPIGVVFHQMFQMYNDGSTVTVLPFLSAGIKSISRSVLKHGKQAYILIGVVIVLCFIGFMADVVMTMKYDNNTNKKSDGQSIQLAPFSVYKYNLGNTKLDSEKVKIELVGDCAYSGLLQAVVEPKKVVSVRKKITLEFTRLVRYWPKPKEVTGNIFCTQPTNITWYWGDRDSHTSIRNQCNHRYITCTSTNPINTTFLSKRTEGNMLTIEVCHKKGNAPRAEFQENLPDLSGARFMNLEIGENNNSTAVGLNLVDSKDYLYISTKHVQISQNELDFIAVKIIPYPRGMIWTLSIGISGFLLFVFLLMITLCICIKTCQQREIQYVTLAVITLRQQDHEV